MAAARDYRREVAHALLWVFFGLLAATIAPDFAIGAKRYICLASVGAMAWGLFRLSSLPVSGVYKALMGSAAVLCVMYGTGFAWLHFLAASQTAALVAVTRLVGAAALFLVVSGLELFSRKLRWRRVARGWTFTQVAVGSVYFIPALVGFFWDFYAPHMRGWRFVNTLHHELAGFDFHGMRIPGIVGGSRWLVLLALVLLAPVTMILVNILRTYVHVFAPPPAKDDSEEVQWSRR